MYKNILVIDLAFIGDVVLATPVVRTLHEAYPEARLTMLTVPLTESVAAMNPYVDEVLVYDKKGRQKGFLGMLRMARQIKKHRFDLAVCLNFAVRGAVVARLAGIPARLGYDAQHARHFLTHVASAQRPAIQHEAVNHLGVLLPLDLATYDVSLALDIPPEMETSAEEKLVMHGIAAEETVVVCPCGSYERKNLSANTLTELVRLLMAKSCNPVLIGGLNDEAVLLQAAHESGLARSRVLAGALSLPELAAFLRRAALLVTVDTGPLHIAQAVRCPTVAVFGPTDPRVWGPRGEYDVVIAEERGAHGELPDSRFIESIDAPRIMQSVLWRLSMPR